jgi:hypothetical protein
MSRRALALFVLFALTLLGCEPTWHVVRKAQPYPYPRNPRFAVMGVEFRGVEIGEKSEAEYRSGKDRKQNESFTEDQRALSDEYATGLIQRARDIGIDVTPGVGDAGAQFIIRPQVLSIEPGFYAGIVGRSSRVEMVFRILLPNGQLVDEVIIEHGTGAGMLTAASGQRLRSDGRGLGALTAEYLRHRLGLD